MAYGSAIDEGLNKLLSTNNLAQSIEQFNKTWNFQFVNKKYTDLSNAENLVYADADFDHDLLTTEDYSSLAAYSAASLADAVELKEYERLREKKKLQGFNNFSSNEKKYFNYVNWLCLRRKGHVMLSSYNKKVMPKIKQVLAVQHSFELSNDAGDTVVAVADMVVEWKDGRRILLDNKTSAREYTDDQAARSQQLIIYHHQLKDKFNLCDDVGFIVMNKNIMKNKTKICSVCKYDGTGQRHKTCSNLASGKRCDGEWNETLDPSCYIQEVINKVTPEAEDLVLSAFDDANEGIKKEYWYKNLSACKQGALICPYYRHCWAKDSSSLVHLPEDSKK